MIFRFRRQRIFSLILIFNFFFGIGYLYSEAARSFDQIGKKPQFKIDLSQRRAFWVFLENHGWLYSGCSYYLNRRTLPENFCEDRNLPVLSGKQDSKGKSHFLIRFKYPGDYYLHFFHQDFEPKFEKNSSSTKNEFKEKVVLMRVIDSQHPDRNPSIEPLSQVVSSSARLREKQNFSRLEEKLDKKFYESQETQRSILKNDLSNDEPIREYQIETGGKQKSQFKAEKNIQPDETGFVWKEHPLQPTSREMKFLKGLSQEDITLLPRPDESAFKLGLYYYSKNTNKGMEDSYRWFDFLNRNYPSSMLALDAGKRAEYLEKYYLLIR